MDATTCELCRRLFDMDCGAGLLCNGDGTVCCTYCACKLARKGKWTGSTDPIVEVRRHGHSQRASAAQYAEDRRHGGNPR